MMGKLDFFAQIFQKSGLFCLGREDVSEKDGKSWKKRKKTEKVSEKREENGSEMN